MFHNILPHARSLLLLSPAVLATAITLLALPDQFLDATVYISPDTIALITSSGFTEVKIERYVLDGLRRRAIHKIDANRLSPDAAFDDSVVVAIKQSTPSNTTSRQLTIELRIAEGASKNFMLVRWQSWKTFNTSPINLKADLQTALDLLMDKLKADFDKPAYRKGRMLNP